LVFSQPLHRSLDRLDDQLPVLNTRVSVRNGNLLIFACEAARSGSLS
jgi:hypothetical protein